MIFDPPQNMDEIGDVCDSYDMTTVRTIEGGLKVNGMHMHHVTKSELDQNVNFSPFDLTQV